MVGVKPGEQINAILLAASSALEAVRPDMSADVSQKGVILTGVGASSRGLPKLTSDFTSVAHQAAANLFGCAVKGGGKVPPQIRQQDFQKPVRPEVLRLQNFEK